MAQTRIIAIGDLHLEVWEKYFPSQPHIDWQLSTVKTALSYAFNKGTEHVIFLGDIFNTPSWRPDTFHKFLACLLEYPKLQFHVIFGNHDFESNKTNSLSLLKFLSSVKQFSNINVYMEPTKVKLDGVRFFFAPWPNHIGPKNPHVCIGHFGATGFCGDNGFVLKKGIPRDYLGDKNFWIIGDLHTAQNEENIVFPGSMIMTKFGESSKKYFLEAEITQGKELDVNWSLVQVKQPIILKTLKLETEIDLKKIKKSDRVFYKLIYPKSLDMPKNIRQEFPNIILLPPGYSNIKERTALEQDNIADHISSIGSFDLMEGINEFLKQMELTPKQIKLAIKYAKSGIREVMK